MSYEIFQADCFDWLSDQPKNSIHGVLTDPPYGLIEFSRKELDKLRNGRGGGVWRIPPTIGGCRRDPLPRFTVLSEREKSNLREYLRDWGQALMPVLVPGAHVFIAGHPMLQYLVQTGMAEAGFEVRGAIMRLYTSFRGGDRPKGAEQEFAEVSVTPRSACEPWMLFRKPLSERTVAENLRRWGTGGLRRLAVDKPLPEAIASGRTPENEAAISDHPCLKPQHLLRILARALLPLGCGVILDPFLGSGSTVAAAQAVGYDAMGVEIDETYFIQAKEHHIPCLAALYPDFTGDRLDWKPSTPITLPNMACALSLTYPLFAG
ncbi:MAG TPA: DNA methyltransferase [Candidatus Competibacteraceae bacterium]|nr:DNA methyltransferase [Candidatus Competibacteraceae bacterium]HRZ07268.1 DNA methyltransferase [Candidatus Competibacteraceae bacterium]HSA45406.1 DNA methyltransferase [Candidatus Competibacteraceae bacterium]